MENLLQNEYVVIIGESAAYIICAFFMFFLGKIAYGLFHPTINIKDELVEKDNFAFSVAHTGYFIGLLLSIGSAIVGPSHGLITDLIDMVVYGGLAIILLNISTIINDKIILRKFSVRKEIIEDRNAGTGVVEAACAISSGLIIFGAVSGESGGLLFGITTAIIFWLAGQFILIITAYIFNLITSYDIYYHIEKDNVAVGIGFAGALIAIANLVRFAVSGDFISWGESFLNVGIDVIIGLAFLPLVRWMADKILLPGQSLTDEIINQEKPNNGVALIEAFAYIGGSILITWCI